MFDDEAEDWESPRYEKLHADYNWSAANVLRGEATPIYTYWPNSVERLVRYNRDAKLVVGLRDPASRAFSHWRMETSRGAETLPFATAVREGRARVVSAPGGVHRVFSYVERGFYANQVARLLTHFDRSQVHFFRTDYLWSNPAATLDGIQRFLGISPMRLIERAEYIVPLRSTETSNLDARDREHLLSIFGDDISATSAATSLDLQDWAELNYHEPMRPD